MSADAWAALVVLTMAPAATLYPILYSRKPWWRSDVGRALMAYTTGMALLIDISLLYQVFGSNYPGRDVVRLVVFGLIDVGVWWLLLSLLRKPK